MSSAQTFEIKKGDTVTEVKAERMEVSSNGDLTLKVGYGRGLGNIRAVAAFRSGEWDTCVEVPGSSKKDIAE